MKNTIQKKESLVNKISEDLKKANAFLLFQYLGLKAKDITILRKKLHAIHAKMYVQRNNIFERAFKNNGHAEFSNINGPTALIVSFGDEIKPFKIIDETIKEYKIIKFKNGKIHQDFINFDQLDTIINIPSKEGLIAMLLSCLQSSIRNLVCGIDAISKQK